MTLRRKVSAALFGCATLLWMAAVPARAQFSPPPAVEENPDAEQKKSDKKDGPVKAFKKPKTKSKISRAQAGKLRLLEMQALARSRAAAAPGSETLSGPPLEDREKVLQALNRMGFGPKPGEVEEILEMGADPWLVWAGYQIDPQSIDDDSVDSTVARRYPWTKMSLQEIKKNYPIPDRAEFQPQLRTELQQSVIYRAANSNRVFKEVMCEFWRNHLCVTVPEQDAAIRSITVPHYEENVIRKHAFGKFRNMLYASATHPAMLHYLDNYISRAGAWNENYARELMELHTMGADRGYTENDVLELTKVLTGWTYTPDLQFTFRQDWHQSGTKKWLKAQVPAGFKGGEMAIYSLTKHKNTATFIAEKLCRYLVNDNPSKDLINRVAAKFRSSDGDLPTVYWEIINSPEFMSRANYRAKFKTPFEFTVAALRNTDAQIESAEETTKLLAKMGQTIYNCDDPTGYYDTAESWMDAGVLTTRWDFAWNLVRGGIAGVKVPDDFFARYDQLGPEETRQLMTDDLIGSDLGDRTRGVVTEAAEQKDKRRMLSVILGAPDFQQQ